MEGKSGKANQSTAEALRSEIEAIGSLIALIQELPLSDEVSGFIDLICSRLTVADELSKKLSPQLPSQQGLPRALVVDDDELQHVFLRRALERGGFEVVGARSGSEALEALQTSSFQIVILDCQMPKMDGFEVARRIRSFERERSVQNPLPILAYTGHGIAGYKQLCLQSGMTAYLKKPASVADITAQAKNLLQQKPAGK